MEDSINKFGEDVFDFDEVEYVNNRTKIKIYCRICREYFDVTPRSFLNNSGCPFCSKKRQAVVYANNQEDIIQRFNNVHNIPDKIYDYNRVKYVNLTTEVEIYCKECDEYFWQKPSVHLRGRGCPVCGEKKRNSKAIHLIDGTICDSLVEAYFYLKYKEKNINFKHDGLYGKKLGKRRYDFYLIDENKYVEVTSFGLKSDNSFYGSYISYLRNIVKKKR